MNTIKNCFQVRKARKRERCADAQEFEREFASGGISKRFGAILAKCEHEKRKMTAEEKQSVKSTAFGMLNENKEEIITEAFTEAVEDMTGEIEDRITEE